MKIALILFSFLMMNVASANEFKCKPLKTTWYLLKAKDHGKKLLSCKTPGCVIKNAARTERNLCRAVNRCESLSIYLENPCTADNKLTEVARAEISGNIQKGLDAIVKASIDFVERIKDRVTGNDHEEETEEVETETETETEEEAV